MIKKALFLVLLMPMLVYAEWSRLTYSDESSIYIDKSSIKRRGSIVEVRQMFDFVAAQHSPDKKIFYRSSIGTESYNCKTNQNKTLSFAWYADGMGAGSALYTDRGHNDYPWEVIPKGSLFDVIKNEICR